MVGISLYALVVFFHLMLIATAIGINLSYAVWIARGRRDPGQLAFALKGVKFLDDYIANPCYLGAGATGLGLLALRGWQVEGWLGLAMGLYLLAMLLAYAVYTPLLSQQIQALSDGPTSAAYVRLAARSNQIGRLMGVLVVLIVLLKTLKPALW
jgi:uncharacterized membrane protein